MAESRSGVEHAAEKFLTYFSKGLNILSAVWLSAVAMVILRDVIGREAFGAPFYGTNEIVSNSVLSIVMLQLPLSFLERRALRSTIVYDKLGIRGRGVVEAVSYGLAALLFLAMAIGGWPNMIEGWEILEQEGSGIIEIPVYPIRSLVVVVSALGVCVCSLMMYQALIRPQDFAETQMDAGGE